MEYSEETLIYLSNYRILNNRLKEIRKEMNRIQLHIWNNSYDKTVERMYDDLRNERNRLQAEADCFISIIFEAVLKDTEDKA